MELGAKITAKDLPEIEVYVYSGSAKALRRTSANWTLAYYLDSDGGRHEVADAKVNDLSAVDTTKAGYRYFLLGEISDGEGNRLTYVDGYDLIFEIAVSDEVDLEMMYTVSENELAYTGVQKPIRVTADIGVEILSVLYRLEGSSALSAVVPTEAGRYVAEITLRGYGQPDLTFSEPYVILPKDLSAEIVIVDTLQRIKGTQTEYAVSYGLSGDTDVALVAVYYQKTESGDYEPISGLPSAVGEYRVVVSVGGKNYTGEKEAIFRLVETVTIKFFNGTVDLNADTDIGEGMYIETLPDTSSWEGFIGWTYEDGAVFDVSKAFAMTDFVKEDETTHKKVLKVYASFA